MNKLVRIKRRVLAASKSLLSALEEMEATSASKSRNKQKRKPRRYYYRETRISR